MNQYYEFSQLRECCLELSGGEYTLTFANDNDLVAKARTYDYSSYPRVWVPQPIEISLDDTLKLTCSIAQGNFYKKSKHKFLTSKGVFISENYGEFGGQLILPNNTKLNGNFVEVFEFGKNIYAISSLNHMCIAYTNIYKFSMNLKENKTKTIYQSNSFSQNKKSENTHFKAIYRTSNTVYILVSGNIGELFSSSEKPITMLFEISEKGIIKHTFDFVLYYVKNMIVKNNKVYIGMDKIVTIIDLNSKQIKNYTPISIEAEHNILECLKN